MNTNLSLFNQSSSTVTAPPKYPLVPTYAAEYIRFIGAVYSYLDPMSGELANTAADKSTLHMLNVGWECSSGISRVLLTGV